MDRVENRAKRLGGQAGCDDGHAHHKRSRTSAQDDDAFASLLAEAGCELVSSREGQEYEVEDPRRLRRTLEQRLTLNSDLRKNFLAALEEHLQLPDVLHAALKPMRVTTLGLPLTGDSFVRLLLNVAPIQTDLASSLLERLPEFIDEADDAKDVPTLLLGQFRWLDQIQDSHGLMAKLVEVLPVCSVDQQRQALALLPEVAGEEDHAAVLDCLEGVLQEEASLVPAALEALANLSLDPDMQARAVDLALSRFQGANAGDLPAVTRFLLQHAAPGNARAVVAALRGSLHFVTIADPRLAVPDVKQKGKVLGGGENPEAQLVEAARQALQLNPVAADAVLKELRAITDPAQHKTVDLWLLLALHRLNPERRKAVEALLRRKFAEGHAEGAWLERGIVGHEKAMAELFPSLLGLAQQLLPAAGAEVSAAGATLYGALFRGFPSAYNQQEVLRVLHGHLGAAARGEASAALGVLLALAQQRLLSGYASFLSSILDHVEGYADAQVEQVYGLFGEIVAAACAERDAGGGAGGDGSRMEDELFVVLRKQLNSTQPGPRRAGVIGAVSLVQRLGAAAAEHGAAADETAVGKRYAEAHSMLKNAFQGCKANPESFAFLCDQLTRAVGGEKTTSRKMLMSLEGELVDVLEKFVGESREEGAVIIGARPMAASLLWNLDGTMAPGCIDILPLLACEVAPGGAVQRSSLLYLFSVIRLVAVVEDKAKGNLATIDALLGCPVKLFSMELVEPSRFNNLEPDQQRLVLTGVFYTLNWCRELANTFGQQLDPTGVRPPSEKADLKLFSRLRLACQLEAVLNRLLPMAPPLFSLPSVSAVGMPAGGALPATLAAPKAKKGGDKGGGGKGGGKGKKSVKFQGGDGGAGGSKGPAKSKSSGGRVTQTISGNSQGGSGTQAASGASADGLDRLAPERWKMRSLLLPALSVLSVGADVSPGCYGMLAPASYLLADLQQKLAAVLAPPKRPSFLRPAAASQAKLQPDVASLTAAEVLAAVRPVLAPLRRHLDTAVIAVAEGLQDEYMEREDRKNVWEVTGAGLTQNSNDGTEATSADFLSGIDDCAVAVAAISPSAAAERLICQALTCVKQLLAYPGITLPANRPALQDLLAAFDVETVQEAGDEAWSTEELLKACRRAFHYFSCKVTDDDEAAKVPLPFPAAHATLQVMQALTAVAVTVSQSEGLSVKSSKAVRRLSARVASGAEAMMRRSWATGGSVGGTAIEGDGQGWRGRGTALGEILRFWISRSEEPLDVVATIAGDLLLKVTDKLGPKAGADWVDPYPSLSSSTMSVWYREAWDALLAAWDAVIAAAASAEKDASLLDDDGRAAVVAQCQRCAAAFGQLMEVVKSQEKRVPIHTQAVKSGGRFVEAFLRLLPFWATAFAAHQQDFQELVKEIQRGTRTIQVLCSEGKSKKELPLAARVPQVKRAVERFVFGVKAFLVERGRGDAFWLGNLKHKSLGGAVLPSQLHEDDEDGSDDEGEEEEAEEEEGCGESQAQSDQEAEEEEEE